MLALVVSLFTAGGLVESAPAGDGGSTRITVTNASVHTQALSSGTIGGVLGDFGVLAGYTSASFLAQCVESVPGASPRLEAVLGQQHVTLTVAPLDFSLGAPALWLGNDMAGTATLGEALRAAGVSEVVRRTPAELPAAFGALRFAPFILASAPDFAALQPAQRAAVEQAVAAGTTLVLATGEGGVEPDLVRTWTGVSLGGAEHPGAAARSAVPRAVALRALTFNSEHGATPRLMADAQPLIVEVPWGLGRVRILAVALDELELGPVAAAAFAPTSDERSPLVSWLAAQPPLPGLGVSPFSAGVWGVLAGLLGLALLSRRAPRLAAGGTLPLLGVALWLPPGGAAVTADHARIALVPVGGHSALAYGSIDLRYGRGGGQTLAAGQGPVALEDVRPGGGCLLVAPDRAAWALNAEPGAAVRVQFLSWLAEAPSEGGTLEGALPWGEGVLRAPGSRASIKGCRCRWARVPACRRWRSGASSPCRDPRRPPSYSLRP